jgi:putative oxidoreductase
MNSTNTFQDTTSLVGRVLLATIFVVSGLSKIADPNSTIKLLAGVGMPLPEIAYRITVLLEVVGGLSLVFGYRVRFPALALAVFSVVAAFMFHGQFADQNQFAHLLKNLSMAGGLLHLAAFGPGAFSLGRKSVGATPKLA